MHLLMQWNPPSGGVEMATVISAPVLLCNMRCMFFSAVKTCLFAPSKRNNLFLFFPFCQSFSVVALKPYLVTLYATLTAQPEEKHHNLPSRSNWN